MFYNVAEICNMFITCENIEPFVPKSISNNFWENVILLQMAKVQSLTKYYGNFKTIVLCCLEIINKTKLKC